MAARACRVLSSESSSESDEEHSAPPATDSVKRAQISRSRVVAVNPGKNVVKERGTSFSLRKKSLWERVKDFPGEHLTANEGRLFCRACSEPISEKKSIVRAHVKSIKHRKAIEALAKTKVKTQTLAEAIKRHDKKIHPVGESLPLDLRVWRLEVVEGFLAAGVPMRKIDHLRHLFERNNYRLSSSTHLSDLIPVVLEKEVLALREELRQPGPPCPQYKSRHVSLIFDGSTRLGEAVAIVARFVSDRWEVQQRLLRLDVVAKSLSGAELAQVVNTCLTDYTIQGAHVIGCMRDGASVNGAALDNLRVFFPKMFDIICFSHTIDNVGAHFDVPTLDHFSRWWVSLFSHSCNAKLRWREQTGSTMRTYSETRWWSRWEVLDQLGVHFAYLQPFLDNNQDLSPKTMDHLRAVMEDPVRARHLQLELAAVMDVGQHFVRATYLLEGDGPLVFSTYRRLQELLEACNADHFPNVHAVAVKIHEADPDNDVDELEQWAKARVRPAVLWFLQKFHAHGHGGIRPMLEGFKLARYFCPVQVQTLHPTAPEIAQLRHFAFLNQDNTIRGLQDELPAYLAEVNGCRLASEEEKVGWWRDHSQVLPNWSCAVRDMLLLQPSSAAAERVFSMLNSAFQDQQQSALTDYLSASVMMRFNNRRNH